MRILVVIPDSWPCTLAECPPGLFVFEDTLGIKTEYRTDSADIEVYVAESGEVFWGGVKTPELRSKLIVTPCHHEWQAR